MILNRFPVVLQFYIRLKRDREMVKAVTEHGFLVCERVRVEVGVIHCVNKLKPVGCKELWFVLMVGLLACAHLYSCSHDNPSGIMGYL